MSSAETNPLAGLPIPVQQEISKLLAKLRRRQIGSSLDVARKTLEIMRNLVAQAEKAQATDVRTLIQLIKRAGAAMVAAAPHELVIGNMVRRVLATVREETADDGKPRSATDAAGAASEGEGESGVSTSAGSGDAQLHRSGPSLMKLLDAPDVPDYSRQPTKNLKGPIIEGIAEVMEELSSVSAHIAEQAIEHIHANEVVARAREHHPIPLPVVVPWTAVPWAAGPRECVLPVLHECVCVCRSSSRTGATRRWKPF